MRTLLLIFIFFFISLFGFGQTLSESQYKNLKGLETNLRQAQTSQKKVDALIGLVVYHSRHNELYNTKAKLEYQRQLEIYAHQTKQPELIAKSISYLFGGESREELKSRNERLFNYAKQHNLNFYAALAKNHEAEYYIRWLSQLNAAQQALNESIHLASNLSDSLKTFILLEIGFRHVSMNNHLQALQIAFQAHETALKLRSTYFMRVSAALFSTIYGSLKNYAKAIDYSLKEIDFLRQLGNTHLICPRHANLAQLFFRSGQPVLGNYHVQEAYRIADSVGGSKRMYNQITAVTIEALARSENVVLLNEFLSKYRKYFFIFPSSEFIDNVILAEAYTKIGSGDSGRALINKATTYFSDKTSLSNRRQYHYVLAGISAKEKNWGVAIEHYKKGIQITLSQNNITESLQYTDSLKTILVDQNMLLEGLQYFKLSDSLKDELTQQQDKEDITKQEVAALEKEKAFQALENEKQKNQRHNLQYLGITFGVVALFISLLLMGIFKVSPRTIKILSFFSFLLFFEFIFLIFKKQIAVVTHGEPLKDLAFMVLLAAVMVPLHHWGEHKVVEYLSTKKFSFPRRKAYVRKTPAESEAIIE